MYGSSSTVPIQKEVMENDPKKAALRRKLAKPSSIPGDPLSTDKSQDPNAALIQKRKRGF